MSRIMDQLVAEGRAARAAKAEKQPAAAPEFLKKKKEEEPAPGPYPWPFPSKAAACAHGVALGLLCALCPGGLARPDRPVQQDDYNDWSQT